MRNSLKIYILLALLFLVRSFLYCQISNEFTGKWDYWENPEAYIPPRSDSIDTTQRTFHLQKVPEKNLRYSYEIHSNGEIFFILPQDPWFGKEITAGKISLIDSCRYKISYNRYSEKADNIIWKTFDGGEYSKQVSLHRINAYTLKLVIKRVNRYTGEVTTLIHILFRDFDFEE
jgi:hypothetical protein